MKINNCKFKGILICYQSNAPALLSLSNKGKGVKGQIHPVVNYGGLCSQIA